MNRRSILQLLGASAIAPQTGVKAAASALGVSTAVAAPLLAENIGAPPSDDGWWDSPLQLAFEIKERSESREAYHGVPYPHMKSWGRGFRNMVAEHDAYILALYKHKMRRDEAFRARVISALGLK